MTAIKFEHKDEGVELRELKTGDWFMPFSCRDPEKEAHVKLAKRAHTIVVGSEYVTPCLHVLTGTIVDVGDAVRVHAYDASVVLRPRRGA